MRRSHYGHDLEYKCVIIQSHMAQRAVRVLPPGGGRSNWCHIWSTRVSGLYWDDAYLQCRYVCDRQPSGQSQARIATVTDVLSRSVDSAAYHPPTTRGQFVTLLPPLSKKRSSFLQLISDRVVVCNVKRSSFRECTSLFVNCSRGYT